MNPVHVIHESYGDHVARKESSKVWYAVLGTMMVLIGFFGGISDWVLHGEFKSFLLGILFALVGLFLVWLWFRRQNYYRNYFRKRNQAPISRISYG